MFFLSQGWKIIERSLKIRNALVEFIEKNNTTIVKRYDYCLDDMMKKVYLRDLFQND